MDWRYNAIWFEQIAEEKKLTWDFKKNPKPPFDIKDIEYFTTWYFKHEGIAFDLLPSSDKLLFLQLIWANIKDFSGVEKFTNLKRLEMHYCTKLESDNGLSLLKDTLEFLRLDHSKKLKTINDILQLKNLKVLCLNYCEPLESLDFLKEFPKLINFRFVDTNVLDGDLTPIIEHPTLRSVGFLNKRHYNYSDEKIDLILKEKSNEEYKDYAYKGRYVDFKLKAYGQ